MRVDRDGAVPNHSTVGKQPGVGQEDPREPGGIHQGPKGGDVVHEGVLRLDEHDVARLGQRLGPGPPAVPPTDHYHRRPRCLTALGHIVSAWSSLARSMRLQLYSLQIIMST